MLFFKACPRCRGDIYVEQGLSEEVTKCLQCGFILYVNDVRATAKAQKPAQARPQREAA